MKKKETVKWWWEVDEVKIHIPTLKEKMEKGLSDKEWMRICFEAHKNKKCFREYSGHKLCDLCPKNLKSKETDENFKYFEGKPSFLFP